MSELEALQDRNAADVQALILEGVMPDPLMLLKDRLDLVTELVSEVLATITNDDALAVRLEVEWEKHVAVVLGELRDQVEAAKVKGGHGHGSQLSIPDSGLLLPS